MSEHDTEVTSISRISNPEVLEDLPSTLNETGTVEEAETETDRSQDKKIEEAEEKEDEIKNNNNEEIIEEKKKDNKSRKPKYKPYRGPIRSAGVRSINKPLDETEKELMEAEIRAKGGLSPVKKEEPACNSPCLAQIDFATKAALLNLLLLAPTARKIWGYN
ncbi:hypothetical protein BSL78_22813 [Apostichopus japonicus]|uniref:Uncharacterized protein n=1 Tax=Stichopus japonicus TaxID=307972 RepID=A0A2G8JXD3_STIJA|nr:hypothetical protein BSL78_22813 [Apostichopus japonicus]